MALVAGGLASTDVLAACVQAGSSGGGTNTLRIGGMVGMSGGFAPWGLQYMEALKTWADMVNDGRLSRWSSIVQSGGGINVGGKTYKVSIDPYDTAFDIAKSVAGAKKLVQQDGAKYILGPIGETEAMATVNPMFTSNGVLNLQLATLWQSQGPQWPTSLNLMTDEQDYYQAQYKWIVEGHPEIKRVATITTDQAYGHLTALIARKWARDTRAFEVVYETFVPSDTTDFNPVVTAALKQNPDLIDIGGAAAPAAYAGIMGAAYTQGFKGVPGKDGVAVKFMATSYASDVILAKIPASYFEGAISGYPTQTWGSEGPTEEAKWFYDQMVNHGDSSMSHKASEWNTVSPLGYYSGRVLLEGMKAANSVDPRQIAKALLKLQTVPTPVGPAGWKGKQLAGVNATLVIPMRVTAVQNGKYALVATYNPPFSWDYNWQGLSGAAEFAPDSWAKS